MTEYPAEDYEAPEGVEEDEADDVPAPPEGDTQDPEAGDDPHR